MAIRGPINPYLVGPPVTGAHGFYGRQDLVETVVNTLTNARQNAIVLHGQRRIGKTSVLHRLQRDELLQQDHLPIFFDMQLYEGFSPARTLTHLAQIIGDKLSLTLTLPSEADLTADYRQFQRTFLPQVFSHLDHKRILILFDEFDVAVPPTMTGPASADTLLGYLRNLIAEESERLAFVFVVGQRLDLLNEGYQRLFKGAQAEPVGRLGQKDTYALLTELGQQGQISYPDEVLAEIWALTNGHPYLTQLVGFEIFDRLQKQRAQQAAVADVTACLDRAMEHGQAALDWFWNGFIPEQQWVLAAVADLTDQQQSVSDTEINKSLQQHLLIMTPLARDKAYQDLLEGDFLIETETRRYRFAVEFIRRWIVKYHPLKEIQRQIEAISPEALLNYQLGQTAFSKGDPAQAEKHFRQALEHNPHFARARVDLAIALRAQNKLEEAIEQGEEAYKVDPAGARDDLINFRLIYINQLNKETDTQAIIDQAERVLAIDSARSEARQRLSEIHVKQANAYLDQGNLAKALATVQKLVEPIPIIQDAEVGQRVHELWLAYSQKLTRQGPPNWNEAQQALLSLKPLDLLDEAAIAIFNQITLDKALAHLNGTELDLALTILRQELEEPLPIDDIKVMLLDYSHQQVEQKNWEQAEKGLKGLQACIDDKDSQVALTALYHDWGDNLLASEKFDKAIAVYRQGETKEFKTKITHAYLLQGAWNLARNELTSAAKSYRQVLVLQNTKAHQEQVQQELIAFYHRRREQQDWQQAEDTLKTLQNLQLARPEMPSLEKNLHLSRAEAELGWGKLDVAFQQLAILGDEAQAEIKTLIKNYLQQQAAKRKWPIGAAALKRLTELLTKDADTTNWRANWLFLWAQALFLEDKLDRKPTRAKVLCQKVLRFAPENTPLLDWLTATDTPVEQEAAELRCHVCTLAARILVDQAQICLDQINVSQAERFFKEALEDLPLVPEGLETEILTRLKNFIRDREFKEESASAQEGRIVIQRLGLGDPRDELIEEEIRQLVRNLKEDELEPVFEILNNRLRTVKENERDKIKEQVYLFSRLYAGRGRWDEAKRLLKHLQQWLAAANGAQEIINARNILNHEQVDFVRSQYLATNPLALPPEGTERLLKRLEAEKEMIRAGYKEAKMLELEAEAFEDWAEKLINIGLSLGHVYLIDHNLEAASQIYEEIIFNVASRRLNPREEINRSLRNYSERMLSQEEPEWLEARLALTKLQNFKLPPPYGQAESDPRFDGAIQRVILLHVEALLKQNRVVETFKELYNLPTPRPVGKIKRIIEKYSQEHRGNDEDWSYAILALEELDKFLKDDRPDARSQDALEWLVKALKERGKYLQGLERWDEAAADYFNGLIYTREASEARRHNIELAKCYIEVKFILAQNALKGDPLKPEIPPVMNEALQCYSDILGTDEHRLEDESRLNKELCDHAFELANRRQWERGHDVLNRFDILYPPPPDHYKKLFAGWRQELALHEVCTWLGERQLPPAFARLGWLKSWLDEGNIPQAGWSDYEGPIKTQLYHDFCQPWLDEPAWELAINTLTNLANLIPNDSEITGWEVDALCRWAEALRTDNNLAVAIKRYREALSKAPAQQSIPHEQIEADLLETQLAYAQQHLDLPKPELEKAIAIFEKILKDKPDDYNHLDRANRIRTALKLHSKRLVELESPAWTEAHKALVFLPDLGLNSDEVITWRQDLILAEVKAWLKHHDLDAAFACLDTLDTVQQPWPLSAIQAILHQHSQEYVKSGAWQTAIEILERFGSKIRKDDSTRQWVHQELTNLGDILSKDNLEGADKAFETAVRFR